MFARVYADGFDLDTTWGLHNRLALLLLNLGCLRRKAAQHLRVVYSVVGSTVQFCSTSDIWVDHDQELRQDFIALRILVDKNVREGDDDTRAYIPEHIPSLGVRPVSVLLHYLRRVGPPSGGFLLAAPRQAALPLPGVRLPPSAFYSTAYTAFSAAFQRAVRRAIPASSRAGLPLSRIGSHSGRKSLAQWLWERYGSSRLVADVGHWRHSGDALNIYFVSSRRVILSCLARL